MIIDTKDLSDRALIGLCSGLHRAFGRETLEYRQGFFPIGGETNRADVEFVTDLREELYARGNGGHRFCHDHLLPLVSPDACDGCLVSHPHPDGINA